MKRDPKLFKRNRDQIWAMAQEVGLFIEWSTDYDLDEIDLLRHGAAVGAMAMLHAFIFDLGRDGDDPGDDMTEQEVLDWLLGCVRDFITASEMVDTGEQ